MLSNSFFDIQSFRSDLTDSVQQKFHAVVSLNGNHEVYKGHFPGNPVVPGVCQIQMVKELVEEAVKHRLNLTESDNIKFLTMINPLVHPQLEFIIFIRPDGNQQISVTASIGSGSLIFLKFKGKFEPAE
jgi:3-hydroxyacyl-[acyl-carrier-protein] dehydratase